MNLFRGRASVEQIFPYPLNLSEDRKETLQMILGPVMDRPLLNQFSSRKFSDGEVPRRGQRPIRVGYHTTTDVLTLCLQQE